MRRTVRRGRLTRPPAADGTAPAPSLFLATPAYGGMLTIQYVAGLVSLVRSLDASGLQFAVGMMFNESLITRARNRLVAQFLRTPCTHLLFLDADVGFHAKDVKMLVESGLEVVCGAYPMKSIGWQNVSDAVGRGQPVARLASAAARYAVNPTAPAANGASVVVLERAGTHYLEVQDAATGFLLLRRDVIERFIAHYREEIEYVADYEPDIGQVHHMVFQADRDPTQLAAGEKARYLSEDYWFSRKWQMMGGKIHLCLGAQLSHTGQYVFEGNVAELLELEPPAAAEAKPPPTAQAAAQ